MPEDWTVHQRKSADSNSNAFIIWFLLSFYGFFCLFGLCLFLSFTTFHSELIGGCRISKISHHHHSVIVASIKIDERIEKKKMRAALNDGRKSISLLEISDYYFSCWKKSWNLIGIKWKVVGHWIVINSFRTRLMADVIGINLLNTMRTNKCLSRREESHKYSFL